MILFGITAGESAGTHITGKIISTACWVSHVCSKTPQVCRELWEFLTSGEELFINKTKLV